MKVYFSKFSWAFSYRTISRDLYVLPGSAYRSTNYVQSGKPVSHDKDVSTDVVIKMVDIDARNSELSDDSGRIMRLCPRMVWIQARLKQNLGWNLAVVWVVPVISTRFTGSVRTSSAVFGIWEQPGIPSRRAQKNCMRHEEPAVITTSQRLMGWNPLSV